MYEVLTIFTPYGATFTFKNVEIDFSNETYLQFCYLSVASGKKKTAFFQKKMICGWSVNSQENKGEKGD